MLGLKLHFRILYFYRSWSSEKLSSLPKVTQQANNRDRIESSSAWYQVFVLQHHTSSFPHIPCDLGNFMWQTYFLLEQCHFKCCLEQDHYDWVAITLRKKRNPAGLNSLKCHHSYGKRKELNPFNPKRLSKKKMLLMQKLGVLRVWHPSLAELQNRWLTRELLIDYRLA